MVAFDGRGEFLWSFSDSAFCGFCRFLRPVLFLMILLIFMGGFVRFCIDGLLSFCIRACVGVSTCSLLEVGLVGPETRVLMIFVLKLS